MCAPHSHASSKVGAPAPSSAPVAQAEHQAAPQQLLPPTPAGGGPWHARAGKAARHAQRHRHPGAAGKWRSAGREGRRGPRLGQCCWRCWFWLKTNCRLGTVPDRTGVRVVERTTCSMRVGACRRALLLAGYIPHFLTKRLRSSALLAGQPDPHGGRQVAGTRAQDKPSAPLSEPQVCVRWHCVHACAAYCPGMCVQGCSDALVVFCCACDAARSTLIACVWPRRVAHIWGVRKPPILLDGMAPTHPFLLHSAAQVESHGGRGVQGGL